jgi:phosphonate transport system substrate-binding protein
MRESPVPRIAGPLAQPGGTRHDKRCHDERRRACLAALAAAVVPGAARGQPPPLRMGLVPFLPPRSLIGVFEPLRRHVETTLAQPVTSFTATDFRALAEAARAGEYDFALLPAHFMRLAVREWRYVPLARPASTSFVVLVVRADERATDIDGLAGRRIVTNDRLSIVAMVTQRWLRSAPARALRDAPLEFASDAASSGLALLRPEVGAIAVADGQIADFTEEDQRRLRVLQRIEQIPTPGWVAHTSLGADLIQRLRAALLSFGGTAGTTGSLSRTSLQSLEPRDLDGVDAFVDELRRLLAQPRR